MARPRTRYVHQSQFPIPQFNEVADSARGKNAWKFFDYWKNLTDESIHGSEKVAQWAPLIRVWTYRTWPRIDAKLVDPNARSYAIEVLEGACPFEDIHDYEDYFQRKYGAGAYSARLTEEGVHGEIMTVYWDQRVDMDAFPPKLDIRMLIQGVSENEPYVNWCRRNNVKIPWDTVGNEESDDMSTSGSAAGEALRVTTEAVVRMAEKTAENADKRAELSEELTEARIQAAKDAGPSPETIAATKSIEMVMNTSDRMVQMVSDRAGKQYDTVEIIKATADLIGPRGGEDTMLKTVLEIVDRSNERVISMQQSQNEMFKTLLLRPEAAAVASPPPPPQKTLMEQLKEGQELAALMGFQRPGAVATRDQSELMQAAPPPPQAASWFNEQTAPIIMMGFQTGMILLANMVHNWSVAKFKPEGVKPVDPGQALQQAAQQTQPGAAPTVPGAAAATPEDQVAKARDTWTQFIVQLEDPFIDFFFRREPSGYSLAAYILSESRMDQETPHGRHVYNRILADLGKKNLDVLIRGNHNIWSKVQGMRQQYDMFLEQFVTYDVHAKAEHERRAAAAAAAPPSPVAPTPATAAAGVNGAPKPTDTE